MSDEKHPLAEKFAEYVKQANAAKVTFAEFNYLVQKDRADAGITEGFMRDVFGDGKIKPDAECAKPPATV